MDRFACFAGVDWGSETHQVCVVDGDGEVLAERSFRHGGAGLAEMAEWILARTGAAPPAVGIAIEVPHGPVVETLMERGFAVHSVNPKQLDRFRDCFSPAGAKDDRRDAHTLADALRTDGRAFRHLDPAEPAIIELREWSRIAHDLTGDRTRLVNRARQQLWRYYPQLLKVESDPHAGLDPGTVGPGAHARQGPARPRQHRRQAPAAPSGAPDQRRHRASNAAETGGLRRPRHDRGRRGTS